MNNVSNLVKKYKDMMVRDVYGSTIININAVNTLNTTPIKYAHLGGGMFLSFVDYQDIIGIDINLIGDEVLYGLDKMNTSSIREIEKKIRGVFQ